LYIEQKSPAASKECTRCGKISAENLHICSEEQAESMLALLTKTKQDFHTWLVARLSSFSSSNELIIKSKDHQHNGELPAVKLLLAHCCEKQHQLTW
jgi:hypothetical protein